MQIRGQLLWKIMCRYTAVTLNIWYHCHSVSSSPVVMAVHTKYKCMYLQ